MIASIVVGCDGSATADVAVRQSIELSRRFGAMIHLVNAGRVASPIVLAAPECAGMIAASAEAERSAQDGLESSLQGLAEELRSEGLRVAIHMGIGEPADLITEVAEQVEADLIVVGNKGMKGARRLLGSVPNRVAHGAPCSVLIVRTT